MAFIKNRLIWVDMEMTGLDPDVDEIMEAAVIITDKSLNIIASSEDMIVHVSDDKLSKMNEWCTKTHKESGLTDACRKSTLQIEELDEILSKFVVKHTSPEGVCPIAGNSVSYDKNFIRKYLPKFHNHLHYRILDVSSIKILCRNWNPKVFFKTPKKKLNHRALDDIKESIEELRYYQKNFFQIDY